MPTLYTAERCPFAARVRIVLAEKALDYDAVEIDLGDRPAWLYEKNPLGKVPVYEEEGGLVLPESWVIMEYLEERFPAPALWPVDPAERALGRLWLDRFDDRLGDAYYALRRGEGPEQLDAGLAELDRALEAQPYLTGRDYGLADIGSPPPFADPETLQELAVELQRRLGRHGVDGSERLVLYDRGDCVGAAASAQAAQLAGHMHVSVLAGGIATWPGEIETGLVELQKTKASLEPRMEAVPTGQEPRHRLRGSA